MDQTTFNALPIDQRKAIQQALKDQNLYGGTLDGKWGVGTATALEAQSRLEQLQSQQQSQADIRKQELAIEQQRIAEQTAAREAAERSSGAQAQQQQAAEESADPMMEQFAPFGAGFIGGAGYGELANRGLNAFERGNTQAMREIADELGPTRDLTNSQLNRARAVGAASAAERFAPTGANRLMNVTGRGLSYGIPAAAIYNEYLNYQSRADESKTEKERVANQQIANALLGGSTGIAVEGGRRFFFPNREEGIGRAQMRVDTARDMARRFDARDAAAIDPPPQSGPSRPLSSQPDAPGRPPSVPPPASPPPAQLPPPHPTQEPIRNSERLRLAAETATGKPLSPKLKKEASYNMMKKALNDGNLSAVAESLNIPRESSRATVLQRAREIMKIGGKSSVMLPLAAGGLAYELSGAPAEAADGSAVIPSTTERLGAAGAAGGAVYGTSKLLDAIPRGAGSTFGPAMAPSLVDAMTDYSDEDVAFARNWTARNMPGVSRAVGGYPEQALDMAQVPDRNPMFSDPKPMSENLMYDQQSPGNVHADPDVARAWQKSPRQTIIELTRSSGLGPEDIAMLAGINVGDVKSIMSSIPRQALSAR